jgi:cell division protein FtsA
MSNYISAGIDIGTLMIRVVIAETSKNTPRGGVKIIGLGKAESRGMRHGYIVNSEDVSKSIQEALKEAEKASGTKIKKIFVGVNGISLESEVSSGSVLISRVDGEVAQSDVSRVISISEENLKLTNKKIVHRFPLFFKLDNKEVLGRPQGMHGMKLEAHVLFVTCLDQHLDDLVQAVEHSGTEVEDVAASPLASSVVTLTRPQRTAGCVLANIGAETVSIAVFENDQLISLKVLPFGSTDITKDIALGLQVPLDDAENIKTRRINNKDYPQKKLGDIIEARLVDIFELIEAHLKKLGKSELLPAGIVLTGGGAGLATIEDLARASLKLSARVVVPHTLNNEDDTTLDTEWSVAYGLCILGFDKSYASDLAQNNHVRITPHLRNLKDWFKQFLP